MTALVFRRLTFEELGEQKYEYFGEDYLDKIFMKPENHDKKSIKIEVLDFEENLIKDPVRGNAC